MRLEDGRQPREVAQQEAQQPEAHVVARVDEGGWQAQVPEARVARRVHHLAPVER